MIVEIRVYSYFLQNVFFNSKGWCCLHDNDFVSKASQFDGLL